MTNHADLSLQLAIALGYAPESVAIRSTFAEPRCEVYRLHRYMQRSCVGNIPAAWHSFDYRDPTVVVPLIKWLITHRREATLHYYADDAHPFGVSLYSPPHYVSAATLEEAVARAVIAVRKGE